MSKTPMNRYEELQNSKEYQEAKQQLLRLIQKQKDKISEVRPSPDDSEIRKKYSSEIEKLAQLRGRPLFYPFIGSGMGNGPFIELMDGSVKYDLITGIGINFFGHSHPEYMSEVIDSVPSDIQQGNLEPAHEVGALLEALLSRVGKSSRLTKGWLTTCGTMANEIALKLVRQKKSPATKLICFEDCFAGRSTAMQEVTDTPGYRVGQPVYGEVHYIPFYDHRLGLNESVENTMKAMNAHLTRYPTQFAAIMMELVQGEGGFRYAPREFYTRVLDRAKEAGLAIWFDEVQTFGRTGELFAYQKFCLNEYADVVTIAKSVQTAAVLYTDEYNPQPGLVAGTFAGSTAALRAARRTIEVLESEKLIGHDGRIEKLSKTFLKALDDLAAGSCSGLILETRGIGGMIAFSPFSGTPADVKKVLMKLFDKGVIAFMCGHGPHFVRFLPPLAVMNEQHIQQVCSIVEATLTELSKESK